LRSPLCSAGGGIKGGQVWGKTDKQGKKVVEGKVMPEDRVATIGYGLGVNLTETIYAPNGRPFTFSEKGKPVTRTLRLILGICLRCE